MTTKMPLLFAIIALLPFGANADYTYVNSATPARVANNGTVTRASNFGPYVTATIEDDDDEHIASTAYVKGAYNDTIAAINRKQDVLFNLSGGDEMYNQVESSDDVLPLIKSYGGEIYNAAVEDYRLISADAVITGIKSQRAEVYTNWDDDTAKTQVAFVTATE